MQIRPDARAAFLRFRDHGDPGGLAECFDLVAQELLLVASHLANRRQQPEDLLQETFLRAIQNADRFDPVRPLEPWLVGILVNVTRNDRRRGTREVADVAVEATPHELGPAELASERELLAALHEAIAAMPVPHREVMTLNLVHGMTPTEIAHATSRPVGTIKSWVHRGRLVVQRRLPAGLTAAFGALLRGMDGLDRVREVVQAEAARAIGVAAPAVAAPAAAVPAAAAGATDAASSAIEWLRWIVPIVVAAPLVWLAARELVRGPLEPPRVAVAAVAAEPSTDAGRSDANAPSAPSARVEPPAADAVATVEIVGEFEAEPFAWQGYVVVPTMPDAHLNRVPFTAGELGTHTFRGVPFGVYELVPDRGEPMPVVVDAELVRVRVPMRGGVDVVGRVVDTRGLGVPGATIWQTEARSLEYRQPVATSGADGSFVVRAATPGRYLSASLPGWRPSWLHAVAGEGSVLETEQPFELVLDEPADELVVEVVDEAGAPLVGATVQLGDAMAAAPTSDSEKARRMRQPCCGRTDESGQVILGSMPRDRPTPLYVRAPGRPPRALPVEPVVGGQTLRVTVPGGASCAGRLTGPDGSSVQGVARATVPGVLPGQDVPGWFWPTCVTGDDGRFTLVGLPAGDVLLQARAMAGGLVEAERHLGAGERIEWSPRIGAGGAVRGRVLDARGQPLAGFVVRASAAGRRAVTATTAVDGTFRLESLQDRTFELQLVPVDDPSAYVLERRFGVRLDAEIEWQLGMEASPTARVRGRVANGGLRRVGLFAAASGLGFTGDVRDDGFFEIGPVPAGSYHLLAGGVRIVLRHDVQLSDGEVVDLGVVDQTPLVPVTVRSAMSNDDAPCWVHVYPEALGPLIGFARLVETCELQLPPGPYRILLMHGDEYVAQRLVTVEGQPMVVELSVLPGEAVLLSAVPNRPVADLHAVWTVTGPGGTLRFTTRRPRGALHDTSIGLRARLPQGEHTVVVRASDGSSGTAQLTVPLAAGAVVPPIELR